MEGSPEGMIMLAASPSSMVHFPGVLCALYIFRHLYLDTESSVFSSAAIYPDHNVFGRTSV